MNKTYSFLLALVLGCMSASAGATLVVGNYNLRYRTLIDGEKYWDYRADNVAQTIRDGAFDVLPRGSWLPRPGRIKLTIHPPVDPPVDEADRRRVIDASYEAVHSALPARHQ